MVSKAIRIFKLSCILFLVNLVIVFIIFIANNNHELQEFYVYMFYTGVANLALGLILYISSKSLITYDIISKLIGPNKNRQEEVFKTTAATIDRSNYFLIVFGTVGAMLLLFSCNAFLN